MWAMSWVHELAFLFWGDLMMVHMINVLSHINAYRGANQALDF